MLQFHELQLSLVTKKDSAMIRNASKQHPFGPREGELTPRTASATPAGPRSVFPGWGPKL
jgi:hypothetical protein